MGIDGSTDKSCQICSSQDFRYKCPTCYLKYCSLPCFTVHKATPCEKPAPPAQPVSSTKLPQYQFSTKDTVPPERLQLLGSSEAVAECLANPHVQRMVRELATGTAGPDTSEALRHALQEPIFRELADACLRVVELPSDAPELASC